MPVSFPEIRTFRGLYLQKNSFTLPDGAMELASNCILMQDNRITKTPGYYQYFSPGSGTLNNLFFYQSKMLAIYLNKMGYFANTGSAPNETGTETLLTGQTVAITSPRVSHSVQASSNLYFTTDNGVLKIDAYNAKIFQAGMPPGLDISAVFLADNGWFTGATQVAYRVLFGRRDANANLLLGAPSEQLVLTNNAVSSVSYAISGAGPYTYTVTSPLHNLATGMTITVTASSPPIASPPFDVTITVTNVNTFTFDTSASSGGSGTLTYNTSRTVQTEFSVPAEITTAADAYFFQIYRTTTSLSAAVSPTPNYRLVEERPLTSAEITARRVSYTDDVDEVLVSYAPELYTNPNSREGELQANLKPPKCDDLLLFKDCVLYTKCVTRHSLNFDLIDAGALANNSYIEVKIGATTRRYVARTGVGNSQVFSRTTSYATPLLTITYASHGFSNGDTVYISNSVGTGTQPSGAYTVSNVAANTFDISQTGITTVTYLEFQGVTNGTYNIFQLDNSSVSISAQLRNTAVGIVKAINRDTSSLVYGFYKSTITDVPGKMQLQSQGFGDPIYLRADTTAVGGGFLPALPDSFASGTQVFSANEDKPNSMFSSKVGESEAVPIANEYVAGSRNARILRAFALRDSVIVLKADGIYRLTGDSPLNFTVTAIDNTIFCLSANSASLLNNQVYFLSNQGVCVVTETSAQILSREKIEDVILPILGKSDLEVETGAVGYESQRTYRLSTIGPNENVKTVTYIYNFINDSWTTETTLFKQGVVGENDTLFLITYGNKIFKERKTQTRIDYCGQNYNVTVTSVASDFRSAVVTSASVAPEEGDVIVKSNVFSRIRTVTSLGANSYNLTFRTPTNLAALDAVILYEGYVTEIDFAPFHAGQVGMMKQFSQMQLHTRSPNVTRLELNFSGYIYGGSETTYWDNSNVYESGALGWGLFPWGFEPWGQPDAIDIPQGTKPAPPIRIYIPRFQQRNTYIKTKLIHREAGESMDIQALDYAVRPYRERVSK